jgi:hypothetical protein
MAGFEGMSQSVDVVGANLVVGKSEVDSPSATCMLPQRLCCLWKENDSTWELIWTK